MENQSPQQWRQLTAAEKVLTRLAWSSGDRVWICPDIRHSVHTAKDGNCPVCGKRGTVFPKPEVAK
jgi:hypothetical protein